MGASSGFSPLDPALPAQSDILGLAWSGQIFLAHDFGFVDNTNAGSFYLEADITSMTVAPEPGMMALLGLGFAVGAMLNSPRRRVTEPSGA